MCVEFADYITMALVCQESVNAECVREMNWLLSRVYEICDLHVMPGVCASVNARARYVTGHCARCPIICADS